jgi:predicted extracellular nuclease
MKKIFALAVIVAITLSCGGNKATNTKSVSQKAKQVNGKKFQVRTIAFYNLENLFDIYDDPKTRDEDFTPEGRDNWTAEKYQHKLQNMAKVLADIGKKETHTSPAIVGVAEVENRQVLEDLIKTPPLAGQGYGIIHFDSPDRRGIDVALLYKKKSFKPINFKKYPLLIYDDNTGDRIYTRDQLIVTGLLDGEKIHFLVGHWPSRRGGEARSRPKRIKAAQLSKKIMDSIQNIEPNAKIVMMGDLNDDPNSPSVKQVLKTTADKSQVFAGGYYNVMGNYFNRGIGTLAYRDGWNLFDQIIITKALLNKTNDKEYHFWKSGIYSKEFMKNRKGRYKGYPRRTLVGGQFIGGYSDHFPTYFVVIRAL